jgi:hypothetical protein
MIKDIIKSFKIKELLLLLLLMCILIWVHGLGMVTMLALWCIFFIFVVPFEYYKGKLFPGILLFTFLYSAFGLMNGFMTIPKLIGLILPMALFYILGRFLVIRIRKPIHLILLLILLLICYQLEVYTSFLDNYFSGFYSMNNQRVFYLGGDENRALTATLVGLNISVSMVGLSSFIILKGYPKLRIFCLVLFFMAVFTTTYLLNRTALVIAIITTLIVLSYFYRQNKIALIVIIASILLASFIVYKMGWISSDILVAYGERNFDLNTAGQRTTKWMDTFKEIFQHPFGWAEIQSFENYYAHNMWLDIARVTGILPFLSLLLVSLQALLVQIRLLRIKEDYFVAVSTGLNTCFLLSCFVEPVYGGLHLFLWTMLWGMQEQYYSDVRKGLILI